MALHVHGGLRGAAGEGEARRRGVRVFGSHGRRGRGLKGQAKIGVVMGEFKRGRLRSSSGGKVVDRKQAVAIALSKARKEGARVPEA